MKPGHLDRLMIGIDRRLVDRPISTTGRAHLSREFFTHDRLALPSLRADPGSC